MKTKSNIVIKVLSLGIGLAVGIVLIAKVFFELSYDSFYRDIDRVYTINTWYSQSPVLRPVRVPLSFSTVIRTWMRTEIN